MTMKNGPRFTGILERAIAWTSENRGPSLFLATIITALCIFAAPGIPFSTDPTEFLPTSDPDVAFWIDSTRTFGALDLLMVGLEERSKPLSTDGLSQLDRITKRLEESKGEGVLLARSLMNVSSLEEADDGALNAGLLVSSIPRTEKKRNELARRLRDDRNVMGALVSNDLVGYFILVKPDPRKDSLEVAKLVMEIVEKERGPLKACYFGAPFISNLVTREVFLKLPWLVPLFGICLFAVPMIMLRRRYAAIIVVLLSSGVSLLWWLGLLRLGGFVLSATAMNAALAVLVAAAIVYSQAAERRLDSGDSGNFPSKYLLLLGLAALASGALMPSSLVYLAHFGRAFAFGMLAVALFGLIGFAPLLTYLQPGAMEDVKPARIQRISGNAYRGLLIGLIVIGFLGAAQLRFLVTPASIFSDDDDVGRALSFFDRRFGGSDFLQIHAKGDLKNPSNLAQLMRVTDLLEGSGAFSDVRSAAQLVGFLGEQFGGVYRIPRSREALDNLWFFLEGNEDLLSMATADRDETMMAARIPGGSDLKSETWIGIAEKAVGDSKKTGAEAAGLRLAAVAKRFGLIVPEDRIVELVALAAKGGVGSPTERNERVEKKILAYLKSPDAPFGVSDEEWVELSHVLRLEADDGKLKAIAGIVATLADFKEYGYPPEMAERVAKFLLSRKEFVDTNLLADDLVASMIGEASGEEAPGAFISRAKGIFVDLLDPVPEAPGELVFTVSGFPAVAEKVERTLLWGVFFAAFALWAVFGVLILIIVRERPVAIRAAQEALVATLLTFFFGWLLGVQIDSSSATMYLAPPILGYLASPRLYGPNAGAEPGRGRFSSAFALAFSAAALTMLFVGIPPVMRLGAALAIGLLTISLVTGLSRRIQVPGKSLQEYEKQP